MAEIAARVTAGKAPGESEDDDDDGDEEAGEDGDGAAAFARGLARAEASETSEFAWGSADRADVECYVVATAEALQPWHRTHGGELSGAEPLNLYLLVVVISLSTRRTNT